MKALKEGKIMMVVLIHSLISVCYSVITKSKYINTQFVVSVECVFLENIYIAQ